MIDSAAMSAILKQSRPFICFLFCITSLALAARLYRLDAESLSMDELVTVDTYPLGPYQLVLAAAAVGQPPLDNFLGAFLYRAGLSHSDWWVRLPSACFGAGSVFLLGIWGRRIGGNVVGWAAASLLAVCPMHVYVSQEARPYALVFFLALACGLLYIRAREKNRIRDWVLYSTCLWGMLMSRWTDPHFIVLGIGLHTLGSWYGSLGGDTASRRLEHSKIRGTLLSTVTAYTFYAPFFVIILSHQKSAIRNPSVDWIGRLTDLLYQSFASLFAGYSGRMLFAALPGSRWLVLIGLILTAIGLFVGLWRGAVQERNFWWIFLPFSVAYGVVYALLGNALPKPQYLLIMAIVVLTAISIALEALRTGPGWWRLRHAAFAMFLLLLLVPMSKSSWESSILVDKTDWRGAMRYLAQHAKNGDVGVCLGSDTVVPAFRPKAYGKNRYGPDFLKFIPVSSDTPLECFSAEEWQSNTNTVWVLAYTDRMYTGTDQVEPPAATAPIKSIHRYPGLILLEIDSEAPAMDRLMATINHWYGELPSERSFPSPAVLLWQYAVATGDGPLAARSHDFARRQCWSSIEKAALEKFFSKEQFLSQQR